MADNWPPDFAVGDTRGYTALPGGWTVSYSLGKPLKQPDPPPLPPVEERPKAGKRLIRWRPLKSAQEESPAAG